MAPPSKPRVDGQAVAGLVHVRAERLQLGGQGGQPVGLVAPDVLDAVDGGCAVGQRRHGRHHRHQLAGVTEVELDAVDLVGAGHGQRVVHAGDVRPELGQHAPDRVAGLMGLALASSGTVTLPPVIAAAARNGAALDRSGSMVTSSGAIGPGATRHRPPAVVDLDAPVPQHRDRHVQVRLGRDRPADVAHLETVGVARADQQQAGDELTRAAGVDARPRPRPGRVGRAR